jgi:hypothetical protein
LDVCAPGASLDATTPISDRRRRPLMVIFAGWQSLDESARAWRMLGAERILTVKQA